MVKYFFVSPLWLRIFNKYNFFKVIIMFVIGFNFRVLIGILLDVSIFSEFTSYIFVTICYLIGIFTVLDNELFLDLNFNKVNLTNNSSNSGIDNSKINNFSSSEDFSKFDKFKNKGKRTIF